MKPESRSQYVAYGLVVVPCERFGVKVLDREPHAEWRCKVLLCWIAISGLNLLINSLAGSDGRTTGETPQYRGVFFQGTLRALHSLVDLRQSGARFESGADLPAHSTAPANSRRRLQWQFGHFAPQLLEQRRQAGAHVGITSRIHAELKRFDAFFEIGTNGRDHVGRFQKAQHRR